MHQVKVLKSIHRSTNHPSINQPSIHASIHPGFTQYISHQNPMTYIYIYVHHYIHHYFPMGCWDSTMVFDGFNPAIWLVVDLPLGKNTSSSVEIIIPNIWKHIKFHGSKLPSSAMNSCDGWTTITNHERLNKRGACDKASRRSSPVIPILSPFGGWNLEGNNNP